MEKRKLDPTDFFLGWNDWKIFDLFYLFVCAYKKSSIPVKLTRKIENPVWKLKKILYTIKQNKIEPK
jgi:hypothetical protein